jgi:5-methylcytosine-specific restriction endonuclease McrA
MILSRDVTCRDPERRHPGEMRAAIVADHIIPLRRGGSWDEGNGQGLCLACHAAKTRRGE